MLIHSADDREFASRIKAAKIAGYRVEKLTDHEPADSDVLDRLIASLDSVVEALNALPDDIDCRGKTWAAIVKLREACAWFHVQGVINDA